MPAGDVNPASLARVTPELPVPSTALRPQTPQVPPSPQTAVPVATLGTTLEECVPPRSPSPAVPVLSATIFFFAFARFLSFRKRVYSLTNYSGPKKKQINKIKV